MPLSKFNISVVGDSRLVGIDKSLNRIIAGRGLPDISVTVKTFKGTDIQQVMDRTLYVRK